MQARSGDEAATIQFLPCVEDSRRGKGAGKGEEVKIERVEDVGEIVEQLELMHAN
jgi:hypothetical protein